MKPFTDILRGDENNLLREIISRDSLVTSIDHKDPQDPLLLLTHFDLLSPYLRIGTRFGRDDIDCGTIEDRRKYRPFQGGDDENHPLGGFNTIHKRLQSFCPYKQFGKFKKGKYDEYKTGIEDGKLINNIQKGQYYVIKILVITKIQNNIGLI